jgi:hypothetical protein
MNKDKLATMISAVIFCGCAIKTVKTLIAHGQLTDDLNKELAEEK